MDSDGSNPRPKAGGAKSRPQNGAEGKPQQQKKTIKVDKKWVATAFITSFFVTIVLTLLSGEVLKVHIIIAFLILLLIILVNIIFDMIGLAIATADEKPFHSMSARKIRSAKKALVLIRNAERVSSVCNDVVGDIAAIVSGATSAAIITKLSVFFINENIEFWFGLLLTALVAGFTVGGKAVAKSIAINYSNQLVMRVAELLSLFDRKK